MEPSRKDVLLWIRNLKGGEYAKAKGKLVNRKGTGFCCLGVWADQHGCVWAEVGFNLIPMRATAESPRFGQSAGLLQSNLSFGLSQRHQKKLALLNDGSKGWSEVVNYIKTEILPSTE